MKRISGLIILSLLFLLTFVYAAVPHLINYQGKLTSSSGGPIDGSYTLTFTIYDAATGGTALWTESQQGVVVQKGNFTVMLGSVNALNLSFDKQYFLEIKVNNETMSPRQQITSVAYAIRAETGENALHAQVADSITDPTSLVPKGAIILCKGACAAGYKRVGELDGKFLVAGPAYNPSAGGSNTKTLSIANLPPHSHDMSHGHDVTVTRTGATRGGLLVNDGVLSTTNSTVLERYLGASGTTGSGQPLDIRPEYATVVLCEKQ